jgi:hypothetical protein
MKTSAECHEIARECEKQASEYKSGRARTILQKVAAQWRRIGGDPKDAGAHGTIALDAAFPSPEESAMAAKKAAKRKVPKRNVVRVN